MAEAAGAKALAASGLEPSEVDLVIVATCSTESPMPNVAATVAYRLGIPAPGAYDLNAACAGFCYGIGAASDSVRAGSAQERPGHRRGEDDLVDRHDRPVHLHHLRRRRGRGRGGPELRRPRIGPVVWGSAGDQAQKITIERAERVTQAGRAGRVPLGDHGDSAGRA